jgi:ketosteroid isomerase-like protein
VARELLDSLREGYRAFGEGDVERVLLLVDPEIEVEVFTGRPDTAGRVYRGHEGFVENFSELLDVFDDFKIEPLEMVNRGDRGMVVVKVTGRGKSSDVPVEMLIYHVWTSREGIATRLEIYGDRETALAALDA